MIFPLTQQIQSQACGKRTHVEALCILGLTFYWNLGESLTTTPTPLFSIFNTGWHSCLWLCVFVFPSTVHFSVSCPSSSAHLQLCPSLSFPVLSVSSILPYLLLFIILYLYLFRFSYFASLVSCPFFQLGPFPLPAQIRWPQNAFFVYPYP